MTLGDTEWTLTQVPSCAVDPAHVLMNCRGTPLRFVKRTCSGLFLKIVEGVLPAFNNCFVLINLRYNSCAAPRSTTPAIFVNNNYVSNKIIAVYAILIYNFITFSKHIITDNDIDIVSYSKVMVRKFPRSNCNDAHCDIPANRCQSAWS